MSNRDVSTELAEAVIDLVRECESHTGHGWVGESYNPSNPAWNSTASSYERAQWLLYVDDVKPAIAKVLDLLMAEVAREVSAAVKAREP